MFGSTTRGTRLKKLAKIPRAQVEKTITEIQAAGKEATITAVLKTVAGEESKKKREASRNAPILADGMELRIGDCREVLASVPDNSVLLILTDPPYGIHWSMASGYPGCRKLPGGDRLMF
jgi:hypothetical protein